MFSVFFVCFVVETGITDAAVSNFIMESQAVASGSLHSLRLGGCPIGSLTAQVMKVSWILDTDNARVQEKSIWGRGSISHLFTTVEARSLHSVGFTVCFLVNFSSLQTKI